MNRREFIRISALAAGAALLPDPLRWGVGKRAGAAERQAGGMTGKNLIVFFSRTGNTRIIASTIRTLAGGDHFQVLPQAPYPEDYRATTRQAREELDGDARPAIVGGVEDMASYDTVFVGYPNWWGTLPMPMFTFLEAHDFTGKSVIPFCTHGGSGLGRGPDDLRRLCPGATLLEGLAVRASDVAGADDQVANWLRRIGVIR